MWLNKLLIIIIENLDNDLFSIEELSSKLFMTSSNLNKKVQHLFGTSTMKLVRNLRLQYAAELLNTQNKSVTEAASSAGFFDAAHLSRYFKEAFDCSPGEYRNIVPFFICIEKLKKEEILIANY
ncbi:AraC family transcriptional regulator [Tenacibaculum ovolyticum]|uniref:helix-turn-helix domain-containing protein n=1 Tax=Tenacibaculum ovolyticum TaxID=104270 RepID=UPI0022F3C3A0|nr:AraC family transcriptional regulator [Tenacibaculum ovolyticum]WBX77724.1 AraC family transcriptional regulator [Tenacibaculum ovolyticum]